MGPRRAGGLGLLLLIGPAGCAASGAEPSTAPFLLDRHPEAMVSVELAPSSRGAVPDRVPVQTPWRAVFTVRGVRTWETELPVRLRTLFFTSPPDDLAVYWDRPDATDGKGGGDKKLRHTKGLGDTKDKDTWEFSANALRVRRDAALGPPAPGEIRVQYSRATTRERELNYQTSRMRSEDFVMRSLQVDDATRHGLLLPAPSDATFRVTIPAGAHLSLHAGLIPPESADIPPSDGAVLSVTVGDAEVLRAPLRVRAMDRLDVDLGAYAGEAVELHLRTEPGAQSDGDYAFLAEPTIYVPEARPPRVVMVFIDTLRVDHLSLYGYHRETTPRLDAWADQAAVFEQARSVAPWTLPSTRTVLTGQVPELWGTARTLPERFAEAGWATAFFAGNVYLSSNFEMANGWGLQRCINWPRAEVQVDRALDWLETVDDRPALLLLHFMDQHLPYTEPLAWRYRFAGRTPSLLGGDDFQRSDVTKVAGKLGEEGKDYLRGRYDNNLAYVDAQLARVLAGVDLTRDTVVIFADHGEEFWDHGGFEHGHALWDELLRVPLVVAGPGLKPGRYAQPVSLLDVAPTLARALSLPTDDMAGWPLQELTDGSRAADFAARPQAFGRLLYGDIQWGSLAGGKKWTVREGEEHLYDLAQDPGETSDIYAGPESARDNYVGLSKGTGAPAALAWRLVPSNANGSEPLEATLTVPGGIREAWVSDDPLNASAAQVTVSGDTATMQWDPKKSGEREIYVVPKESPSAVLPTLQLTLRAGDKTAAAAPTWDDAPPALAGDGKVLLRGTLGGRTLNLTAMVTPLPLGDGTALSGFNPEVAGELGALGYLDHREETPR